MFVHEDKTQEQEMPVLLGISTIFHVILELDQFMLLEKFSNF